MTDNTKRTASIDLAQLDKKHVTTLTQLLICCLSWEPQVCVLGNVRAGDAAEAIQQLLARRSLTSGAPTEPAYDAGGQQCMSCNGTGYSTGSPRPDGRCMHCDGTGKDAAAPSTEQVQWRNIQKVVQRVAEFCFGGPQQEGNVSMAAAYISVIRCLTAEDGVDLKLEPLSAGAAAKTEQAPIRRKRLSESEVRRLAVENASACSGGEYYEFNQFALDAFAIALMDEQATAAGAGSEQPLPPLPRNYGRFNVNGPDEHRIRGWISEQMQEYGRACYALARAPLPEQDDDARDAARWRFIVKDGKNISGRFTLVRADDSGRVDELHGGEYDRVIDAAMSASRPDDKGDQHG